MIPELAALLRSSVAETLEDRVAIAFSGGLDSTLIATLAARDAKTELFTCGTERCDDVKASEELAFILNLPLRKSILGEDEILDTYRRCYDIVPGDLLKVELLVPVYKCAEAAKACGHEVMLFGTAAEELFVGYERYFSYLSEGKDLDSVLKKEFKELRNREIAWIAKVCRKFGIEARFPLYKKELETFVRAIPLEVLMEDKVLKKGVLREAGKLLGVPQIALERRKRAMQYGSGIHNIIRKHSKSLDGGFVLPQPSSSPSM